LVSDCSQSVVGYTGHDELRPRPVEYPLRPMQGEGPGLRPRAAQGSTGQEPGTHHQAAAGWAVAERCDRPGGLQHIDRGPDTADAAQRPDEKIISESSCTSVVADCSQVGVGYTILNSDISNPPAQRQGRFALQPRVVATRLPWDHVHSYENNPNGVVAFLSLAHDSSLATRSQHVARRTEPLPTGGQSRRARTTPGTTPNPESDPTRVVSSVGTEIRTQSASNGPKSEPRPVASGQPPLPCR
jgi:hypothetical protein